MHNQLLVVCSLAIAAAAQAVNPIRGNGFIGKGITMFHPTCASACRDSLSTHRLSCSTASPQSKRSNSYGQPKFETSPSCYASDIPYLTSVASCINTHCPRIGDSPDTSLPNIEAWWDTLLVGREATQPKPIIPFSVALMRASKTGSEAVYRADAQDKVLNNTTVVDEAMYTANYNAEYYFELSEERHVDFGLVLFLSGLGLPVILSWLRFVPFPRRFTTRWTATFINPPLIGRRHREPIESLFLMPTRGQAFFIAYLFAINIILCTVGYTSTPRSPTSSPDRPSNAWFPDPRSELLTYIANRTGVLCFANMPLLIIYASRNNPLLLWLTDWSHATFLMLHRWVAIIATLQASAHSWIYFYQAFSAETYADSVSMKFWLWGTVAILTMVVMLPASMLPIRRKVYELFLACHVILAVLVLIAGYLHVRYKFQGQWGFENWLLYLAVPIWGAERIARVCRFARHGVLKARVTLVTMNGYDDGGAEYVRVDIPGVVAAGNAYLYFPTLSWRVWENHPFSVAGNMLPTTGSDSKGVSQGFSSTRYHSDMVRRVSADSEDFGSLESRFPSVGKTLTRDMDEKAGAPLPWPSKHAKDAESDLSGRLYQTSTWLKSISGATTLPPSRRESEACGDSTRYFQRGSTFFVRASKGITARLRKAAARGKGHSTTISVLVEASYRSPAYNQVIESPNVIAIAGGVGITAVAPLIQARTGLGRTRLFWGLRDPALFHAVADAFGKEMLAGPVLGEVATNGRLDVRRILEREVPEAGEETVVVVCGPGSMADAVRGCVDELARRGRMVRLADETFAW